MTMTPTITNRWVRGLAYVFVGLFALESSREYVVYGADGADSTGGASPSSSGTPATNSNGSSSTGSGMLDSIAALSVLHVCVCICANIVSKHSKPSQFILQSHCFLGT
jgi:hypothetical protein